MMTTMMTMGAT
jgi:hypothetical protein